MDFIQLPRNRLGFYKQLPRQNRYVPALSCSRNIVSNYVFCIRRCTHKHYKYQYFSLFSDSLHPVIIGSIAGVASLFLVLVLAAAWFICRKKKRVLFDPTDPIPFPDDYKMDRSIPISQSTPELGVDTDDVKKDSSPIRRGIFQISSRQSTLPSVPQRHQTFQRMLSHRLDLSNIEFSVKSFKHKEQPELGSIKPELYKQASVDSLRSEHVPCGKLFFSLKYVQEECSLHVLINRAEDLPAKDFSGTSDPYVKVYLLPDRKTKHQTKVHRKTLSPEFNELFVFGVQYEHMANRTLQFSLYDFDRFSRHDPIGAVIVKDILGEGSLMKETFFVRDIFVIQQVSVLFLFQCRYIVENYYRKLNIIVVTTEYPRRNIGSS